MKRFVYTSEYESSHRKQPRGYGLWVFSTKDETWQYIDTGMYSEVKRDALKKADDSHLSKMLDLYVMP